MKITAIFGLLALTILAGCGSSKSGTDAGPSPSASVVVDAAVPSASASISAGVELPPPTLPPLSCPREMMAVANHFCVDKWEASLVDKRTGIALSPYYPPDRKLAVRLAEQWERDRSGIGSAAAREVPIPALPSWQRTHDPVPLAISRAGVVPNGYLTGVIAAEACKNANKRLCTWDEWRSACRGQVDRQFPYGESYEPGACNIFRRLHPAMELHDNPALGHTDPRLNLVKDGKDPLLRRTGATARCKSEWGEDAAWDMNGNLDEWIDDEKGRFVGGFFSRSKKDGCESSVGAHPNTYFDYSTGVRCCKSPDDLDFPTDDATH